MSPTVGKRAKERFQVLHCNVRIESKGMLGFFGNEMHCASLINLSTSGLQVISFEMPVSLRQACAGKKNFGADRQRQGARVFFKYPAIQSRQAGFEIQEDSGCEGAAV